MEIERKFLCPEMPVHLPIHSQHSILQGYVSTEPEVRIRCIIDSPECYTYNIGFKSLGNMVREEIEINITSLEYYKLMNFIGKPMIRKDLFIFYIENSVKVECNVVEPGTNDEWRYIEVEFQSVESAKAFVPPSWFGKEVTEDPHYKMRNYWKRKQSLEIRI